jgi:serine/threonine protein kinase
MTKSINFAARLVEVHNMRNFFKRHTIKTVIAPEYETNRDMLEFVDKIQERFNGEGELIFHGRNTLKRFELKNDDIIVKKFAKPNFINSIVYAAFRKSKAERSYINSREIIERGFRSPTPIAYIEEYKYGKLSDSYYICEYLKKSNSMRPYLDGIEKNDALLMAFSRYTAELHCEGILHKDYSPGNILWEYDENSNAYAFYLVDTNRMKFVEYNDKKYLKNLSRLSFSSQVSTFIAKEYVAYMRTVKHMPMTSKTVETINEYADCFFLRKTYKYALRNILKQPFLLRIKGLWDTGRFFICKNLKLCKKLSKRIADTLFSVENNIYIRYIYQYDTRKVLIRRCNYGEISKK